MDLITSSIDIRYCVYCGAQIQGPGSWGHDDNCRTKHNTVSDAALNEPELLSVDEALQRLDAATEDYREALDREAVAAPNPEDPK